LGAQKGLKPRVVFDTGTVVSAMFFAEGRLHWLRSHWVRGDCIPLISSATAAELTRVLAYPKFRLPIDDRRELLAEYLPFCKVITSIRKCKVVCRDAKDQPFLDLAESGEAEYLVTGDRDLLAVAGTTSFQIETPNAYRSRLIR
jgi:putative PIN family toxin of toxin-antitoxin system